MNTFADIKNNHTPQLPTLRRGVYHDFQFPLTAISTYASDIASPQLCDIRDVILGTKAANGFAMCGKLVYFAQSNGGAASQTRRCP